MCTDQPKEFLKSTEVLPFTKYGVSTLEEFEKAEKQIQHLEWLKRAGLTNEEIKLYQDNEVGLLEEQNKVETGILKHQLELLYRKIKNYLQSTESEQNDTASSTANSVSTQNCQNKSTIFYPEGHPIHNLKELEQTLFESVKSDITPITRRRKILRRLERRKKRLLSQQKLSLVHTLPSSSNTNSESLWDVKNVSPRIKTERRDIIGPKDKTLYTIKDNRIVRLEQKTQDEYHAVNIVVPQNKAEEQLLEGTKMNLDDIKRIERFKDYEPGIPSKVLYLKNIAPTVTEDKLGLLFKQFQLGNGSPIEVKRLSGRMRGQAFVHFKSEDLAIQALDEVNGTIISGRPIIAQFGRHRAQNEDHR